MANKKRKCKFCEEYKEAEKGVKHPIGWFCCQQHAVSFVQDKAKQTNKKKLAKAKQVAVKKDKTFKKDLRERKEAIKPKSKWLAEAQAAFNKYIRLRDYHEPCISCDKPRQQVEAEQGYKVGGCWDAGHFQTRGAKGQLRFILFNVHKQCKSCNGGGGRFSHKAATVDEKYKTNLIKKIGPEKVEWLETNNDLELNKGNVEYLKRVKKIFSKRARYYENKIKNSLHS